MKVLGLDLDGVIYKWHTAVYEYFRLYRNYLGSYNDFWSKDYLSVSEETWEFITNIDYLYSCINPDQDCRDFLENVQERFEIYYVTSRPVYVKLTTEQFLKRFKFPFQENLIFCTDKVNIARKIQADYFIEDMPRHIEGLSKVTKVIVMAQPYNIECQELHPTIHHLMEALQFLED